MSSIDGLHVRASSCTARFAISVIARLKSLSAYALSWQLHLLYISIITE